MAWETQTHGEMVDAIRRAIQLTDSINLASGIAGYNYDIFHGIHDRPAQVHHKGPWSHEKIMKDPILSQRGILESRVEECIFDVATTSNGGHRVYVDFDGHNTIDLSLADDERGE